ncbi:MAG: 16S rRNA (guanine(527)-N(7))-methyltransferase RsmG [Bacteriovoracia bacterium]
MLFTQTETVVLDSQRKKLDEYAEILLRINEGINLTGAKNKDEFERKHIQDSVLAFSQVQKTNLPVEQYIDVGSGGGIPGIILAILSPATRVTLVERRVKKATALLSIVKELGLEDRVKVLAKPFEEIKPVHSKAVIWFRGFLPGPKLIAFLSKNFKAQELPTLVLMKGPSWSKEKEELLLVPNIAKEWRSRFEKSETISYKLPENSGDRVLVFV